MPVTPPPPTLWVAAAPFRYHVHHLSSVTGVPWQVIAVVAGLTQQQVRTLMFGRHGRLRPRISPYAARRLLSVDVSMLRRLQLRDVPLAVATEKARTLLADGMPIGELAAWVNLDVHSTSRLLKGLGRCSGVTDILLRLACIRRGLLLEREAREVA